MKKRKKPRTKFINVTTTDLGITNLADALWHYSSKIEQEGRAANVSSLLRDRLARVTERLKHYAVELGHSLETPNSSVFANPDSTRKHLNRLLDRQQGIGF